MKGQQEMCGFGARRVHAHILAESTSWLKAQWMDSNGGHVGGDELQKEPKAPMLEQRQA